MKKQGSRTEAKEGKIKVKAPKQPVVTKPTSNKVARTEANKQRRIEKDRKIKEQAEAKKRRHLRTRAKQNVTNPPDFTPEQQAQAVQHELGHLLAGHPPATNFTIPPDDLAFLMLKRWRMAKKAARTIH